MIRSLAIVALAGLLIAAGCFSGALGLGWRPWNEDFISRFWHDEFDGDDASPGERATREIPWEGGDSLSFMLPGAVHYTQGPETKITVTGPRRVIDDLSMAGDTLMPSSRHGRGRGGGRLQVDITAPTVTHFTLHGAQDFTIDNYAQDELEIEVNGSGDVVARGAARRVDAKMRGSGDIDLSRLTGDEVRLEIMGSGDARIAPRALADVSIMGSGDVTLFSDSARVESKIMGSGEVDRRSPLPASPPSSAPDVVTKAPAESKRHTSPTPAISATPPLLVAPVAPPR